MFHKNPTGRQARSTEGMCVWAKEVFPLPAILFFGIPVVYDRVAVNDFEP